MNTVSLASTLFLSLLIIYVFCIMNHSTHCWPTVGLTCSSTRRFLNVNGWCQWKCLPLTAADWKNFFHQVWNFTCTKPAVRISHLLTLAACCFRRRDQLFGLYKRRHLWFRFKERMYNPTLVQNVFLTGFSRSSGLCGVICSWQDMSSSRASSHLKYFRIWTCKQFLLESRFNELSCCRMTNLLYVSCNTFPDKTDWLKLWILK